MGVISRRPQNVNISAKRTRAPDEEETRTYREGMQRRIWYVAKRKSYKKEGEKGITQRSSTIVIPSDTKISSPERISKHHKHFWSTGPKVKSPVRKTKKNNEMLKTDISTPDTEWEGKCLNQDSEEYTGREKGFRLKKQKPEIAKSGGIIGTIFFHFLMLVKAVVSAISNIIVVAAVATLIIVITTLATIQSATYNFLVDEEANIASYVSRINNDFSESIETQKIEKECEGIKTAGKLADWKEIVAFWWVLVVNGNDIYLSGKGYESLKSIFYEFNTISYEATEEGDKKILNVTIKKHTLNEMYEQYEFGGDQIAYVDELLNDDELWEKIFSTDELARLARAELGQSEDKYLNWYKTTDKWNMAYMMYLLDETKMLDCAIKKTISAEDFLKELQGKNWIIYMFMKEGDIVFIDFSGELKCGIITGMEDDVMYVTIADYPGYDTVVEVPYAKKSAAIKAYARIDVSRQSAASPSVAAGELIWPVTDYYYVTSSFGPRDLLGMSFHHGMDIGCPIGTPVHACADGVVVDKNMSRSIGLYVQIDHGSYKSIYMHNSSIEVQIGQEVKAGDVIAYSGNTGQSTGPHCHIGISTSGVYTDPALYFGLPAGFTGDATEYMK